MLRQKLESQWRYGDKDTDSDLMNARDEAACVGFFPNGKARAGRARGVDDIGIRLLAGAYPRKKIEHQRVYGIGRGHLLRNCGRSSCITSVSLRCRRVLRSLSAGQHVKDLRDDTLRGLPSAYAVI